MRLNIIELKGKIEEELVRDKAVLTKGRWYKSTKEGAREEDFNIYFIEKMLPKGYQIVTGLSCYGKWVENKKRSIGNFNNYFATEAEIRLAKRKKER